MAVQKNKVTTPAKQTNWAIIGLIAAIVAFIFFMPFWGTICISILLAFLFYPIHKRLTKHMSESIAAYVTLVLCILIFAIPAAFIGYIVIVQGLTIAHNLSSTVSSAGSDLSNLSVQISDTINNFLAPLGNKQYVTPDNIVSFVQSTLPDVINGLVNSLMSFVSSLPKLFTSIIVFCFIFTALLRYNKSAIAFFKAILPVDEKSGAKYIERSGMIVTASLRGQFIISFVTAVSSAFVLIFLGLGQYFMLFTIFFTLLGMVPLGAGIVMIPICLINMATGNFWPGLIVLLVYLLIICNIDTLLRPHLIPKKANMIPALVTLATFCGIYYFGILGIIYGPLVVILLTTTADIYISTKKQDAAKLALD